MLKAAAIALATVAVGLSAVAVGAQPAPSAPPFVIGTFQPEPVQTGPTLPNIGRTRALNRACAAMRDIVVPSFQAAMRADERFVITRKALPNYSDISTDPSHQDDGYRQMLLSKLDRDASALLQESLEISKLLGDPRIANNVDDPQVMAERRSLQILYETQQTRANLLNEFVIREHVATAKDGTGDNSAFAQRGNTATMITPRPIPIPQLTAAPGMPLRSLNPLADRASLTDWGTNLQKFVRTGENEASKTFLSIAKTCK